MIGIIASMDDELKLIKEQLKNLEITKVTGTTYYKGTINEKEIVLVKCLTGKVHMALTAQKLIDNFLPNILMNVGVAGGLKDEMNIGDVVIATKTIQSDMDAVTLGWGEIGVIPDINIKDFITDKEVLEKSEEIKDNYEFNVLFGTIVTADKFVTKEEDKEFLINQFDGYCTDMETAALGQVCYTNNISFMGIRGISDAANSDANTDFRANLVKASDNCGKLVVDLLNIM